MAAKGYTRSMVDRDFRRVARERLKDARAKLKDARALRRMRLIELRDECKQRRRDARQAIIDKRARIVEDYRARLADLARASSAARESLRTCGTEGRAEAREAVKLAARRIEEARRELAWLRGVSPHVTGRPRGLSRGELRAHLRDEARANIEAVGADEAALFDRLYDASKLRGKYATSERQSLTEGFWLYLHDHPEALSEHRHREEIEALARLARDEAEAWEVSERAKNNRRRGRSVVIPSADGAGASWEFG